MEIKYEDKANIFVSSFYFSIKSRGSDLKCLRGFLALVPILILIFIFSSVHSFVYKLLSILLNVNTDVIHTLLHLLRV